MTEAGPHGELRAFLAEIRRRWTTMVALGRAAVATAAAASSIAVASLIDRVFHPDGLLLVVLFGTAVLIAVSALAIAAARLPRRPSDRQVARFVEERTQATQAIVLDDALVSAVDAADRPPASRPAFLPLILGEA